MWLAENLPCARLVALDGEEHMGIYEHLSEVLGALAEPDTKDAASKGRD